MYLYCIYWVVQWLWAGLEEYTNMTAYTYYIICFLFHFPSTHNRLRFNNICTVLNDAVSFHVYYVNDIQQLVRAQIGRKLSKQLTRTAIIHWKSASIFTWFHSNAFFIDLKLSLHMRFNKVLSQLQVLGGNSPKGTF